jgi:hypothetical protein
MGISYISQGYMVMWFRATTTVKPRAGNLDRPHVHIGETSDVRLEIQQEG